MNEHLINFKQENCSVDLSSSLKVILIWIIGVFHGNDAKTKLEREKQRTRGSA